MSVNLSSTEELRDGFVAKRTIPAGACTVERLRSRAARSIAATPARARGRAL
jgi:hypothetical protein